MALCSQEISTTTDGRHRAATTRTQIRQLSIARPDIAIDDAYAIKTKWVEIKIAEAATIKGRKIGLTSRAIEERLDIDEPDCGVLFDDMFAADGGRVPSDLFLAPRLKAELAFIVSRSLAAASGTMFDVLNATDFAVPAFEILDGGPSGSTPSPRRRPRSRPARATQSRPIVNPQGRPALTSAQVE